MRGEPDHRDRRKSLPAVGIEPTRGYPQRILSPQRLPFRHAGLMRFNGWTMIRLPRKFEKMQPIAFEWLLLRV